jgi:hypothetical protein
VLITLDKRLSLADTDVVASTITTYDHMLRTFFATAFLSSAVMALPFLNGLPTAVVRKSLGAPPLLFHCFEHPGKKRVTVFICTGNTTVGNVSLQSFRPAPALHTAAATSGPASTFQGLVHVPSLQQVNALRNPVRQGLDSFTTVANDACPGRQGEHPRLWFQQQGSNADKGISQRLLGMVPACAATAARWSWTCHCGAGGK